MGEPGEPGQKGRQVRSPHGLWPLTPGLDPPTTLPAARTGITTKGLCPSSQGDPGIEGPIGFPGPKASSLPRTGMGEGKGREFEAVPLAGYSQPSPSCPRRTAPLQFEGHPKTMYPA